jgi:hypothetical protein
LVRRQPGFNDGGAESNDDRSEMRIPSQPYGGSSWAIASMLLDSSTGFGAPCPATASIASPMTCVVSTHLGASVRSNGNSGLASV